MISLLSERSLSPLSTGCSPLALIVSALNGWRTTVLRVQKSWNCITCIAQWLGWEKNCRTRNPGHLRHGAPRTLLKKSCFSVHAICFHRLDLVFFDTTSIYFEGEGGQTIGELGHTKDHRPDLKQMVVGAIIDGAGRPICCELWPGNTADVKSLIPVVDRLRSRFSIGTVCVVADRGMISQDTIMELESRQWPYILGARMRNQKEVRDEVLSRGGRYQVVPAASPLKVKEGTCGGQTLYCVFQ